ncbi:MAG TPA: glycoside hydrolase domain-containing protein [Acidobacteriaceae bacterium]|nr:glycoside hydrolase domain-containing protein [Acidobacteriaceae bacterium]
MLCFCTVALVCVSSGWGQASTSYIGFDKNDYPGDALLPALHRSFAYTGYWLNNPPGASTNGWIGKRTTLKAAGFGFLILFNGRSDAQLKGKDAAAMGRADAAAAVAAAQREGFPPAAILFLDQEEGGRLLPEQSGYLFSWVKTVRSSQYRPGVYCSGISVPDGSSQISTAKDILSHDSHIALWVANDQCPPSPGCVVGRRSLEPASSGITQATVWQYALSPRRPFAAQCGATYSADNYCYAPGVAHSSATFLDLDVSASADPSHGR